ncbi:aminoglycoside O-phosphotransferase APH(9)-Ib [Streptomyces netropsis]|uniref:SpcN n=1 Tax=Streptomyces netropsis TaxID=55404 RepID=P72441_STRNE|nr:aminoglycoside O-phosphotransferase APH(9)-Ib [Streptomyces netropsis]AAB66655.1 SpcN [Streptomyces netropsis]
MEDLPENLDQESLFQGLREFGISTTSASYAPLGFGDYHWHITGDDGQRWFATVSDLEHKEHCGHGAPAALRGLRRAMDTAVHLREQGGLPFVVAPRTTSDGASLVPLDSRYALTVFPHVSARPGEFGQKLTERERDQVLVLLAELHGQAPPKCTPTTDMVPTGLDGVHTALAEPSGTWTGGPFSEPARELLAEHEATLRGRMAEFGELVARVRGRGAPLVVTHGEPHPGNLILGEDGYVLVDWDTVGLAIPERDLSLISDDPAALARYTELTGHTPDPAALALYRLRWSLLDVAEFVEWFRGEHQRTSDTEAAWQSFAETLDHLNSEVPS